MTDSKTILLVDDEEDLTDILSFYFQEAGFKTFTAQSGNEGFNITTKEKIDMVISDIQMPNGDGVELLKKIRDFNPNIPSVGLVTGYSKYSEDDIKKLGAAFLMKKPIDMDELVSTVKTHLGVP